MISWLPAAHIAERDGAPLPPDRLRDDDHRRARTRARSSPTCPPSGRPGSSPCRGSGRSSRPGWRASCCQREDASADREWLEAATPQGRARAGAASRCPTSWPPPSAEADAQLFAGLRAMLGLDEVVAVNVGAAPTPREVLVFFHAIGIPLAELWGMSETCGAGCCNPPGADQDRHRRAAGAGRRGQARRRRRAARALRGRDDRLPQRARQDRRGDRRRRLAAHRRHRRDRRRRLRPDRRPQEGDHHQRGRQEHVAGQHRVGAEGRRAR